MNQQKKEELQHHQIIELDKESDKESQFTLKKCKNIKKSVLKEEISIKCPVCPRLFKYSSKWKKHFSIQHKEDPNFQRYKQQINEQDKLRVTKKTEDRDKPQKTQRRIRSKPQRSQKTSQGEIWIKHKSASLRVLIKISKAWQANKTERDLQNIQDVLLKKKWRITLIQGQSKTLKKRQQLRNAIASLVKRYELYDLNQKARLCNEFWDYRIPGSSRPILNFSWNVLEYFKPQFAAKMLCIMQSLCIKKQSLKQLPGFQKFIGLQWQKYDFITKILRKYRRQFLEYDLSKMIFL